MFHSATPSTSSRLSINAPEFIPRAKTTGQQITGPSIPSVEGQPTIIAGIPSVLIDPAIIQHGPSYHHNMAGHQDHMNQVPIHPHPHHHQAPQHQQIHHGQPIHHNNLPQHMGGGGGGGGNKQNHHRSSVQNRIGYRNNVGHGGGGGGPPMNHVNNYNNGGGEMYGQQAPIPPQGSSQPPNEVAHTFVVFLLSQSTLI